MRRFRDIEQVRQDLKSIMPLNQFIELVDNKPLEYVHDNLYKKSCDLDEHPLDDDGTRDSTPSFTVAPNKELWYCFGCGSGGDRFEYVSRKLHLEHIESIYKVAEISNFDLSSYYEELTDAEIMINNLFDENKMAKNIAHSRLLENKKALDYLTGRGISIDSIEEYELGYAEPLDNGKVTMFDTVPNNIALQLDRKDMFNDAILFPICDVYGRMRYFQSRPFKPMTAMKYIGGSETHPLYNDDDRIYGFHIARKKLSQSKGVMVGVEGAPDTIMCNQCGIPTIGFLGVTINERTMELLDRFKVKELIILLDGDKTGRSRSISTAQKYLTWNTNVRLRIAVLPDGYDPNDFINEHGPDALKEILDKSTYAVQYLIDTEWHNRNPETLTDKIEYLAGIQKYFELIHDDIIRKLLINHVADMVGLDPMEIEDYYIKTNSNADTNTLYNQEGEELLLAEAIRNNDLALDLFSKFSDDDWYLARHKALFKLLKDAKYTDIDSLFIQAQNMKLDKLITHNWLEKLEGKTGNVEFALQDVYDKAIRRKTRKRISKLDIALTDMSQETPIVVDQAVGDIYNIAIKNVDEMIYSADNQVNDTMNLIHERMKNPGKIIGYSFGPNFEKCTQALLGLQTKLLTIVAANQSVGKTQIVQNWAMHMSVHDNVPVLWISLEMDKVNMTFRNLSILSGLPTTALMTGNLSLEDKMQKLDPWAARLANAPFYLSERGHDLAESLSIARRYVVTYGVKVIVIDYLQLQYVSGKFGLQRHRELGIISKGWKQFAKEMDVSVIGISQLNKDALTADIAKAEHGAGSYEIAQDADNYITLKEKSEEEIETNGIENGNIIANFDKVRMGQADILLNLYADRPVQRISEV